MSFIRASGLGPLTASNTATIVDPATPLNGVATMGPLVSFAAVAASGTSVTFTGIPSWVKRVTISLSGVTLSSTSAPRFRIGPSGGVETSGYLGSVTTAVGSVASQNWTTGFDCYSTGSGYLSHGSLILTLIDSTANTWAGQGIIGMSGENRTHIIAGSKSITGGPLSVVSVTTLSGTDTFTSGKIGVMYE